MINVRPTMMETHTGRLLDLANPKAEDIEIEAIAYALGHIYRYGGHAKPAITVAEHSCAVEFYIHRVLDVESPAVLMGALMHDAHEAYFLGDCIRPATRVLSAFACRELEVIAGRIITAIESAIGFSYAVDLDASERRLIEATDDLMLQLEAVRVMKTCGRDWCTLSVADRKDEISSMLIAGYDENNEFPRRLDPDESCRAFLWRYAELATELQEFKDEKARGSSK